MGAWLPERSSVGFYRVPSKPHFSVLAFDFPTTMRTSMLTRLAVSFLREIAEEEVEHLFASADDDHDGLLSFAEILDHHDVFVGSEATDYGDHLNNIHRFEDEL